MVVRIVRWIVGRVPEASAHSIGALRIVYGLALFSLFPLLLGDIYPTFGRALGPPISPLAQLPIVRWLSASPDAFAVLTSTTIVALGLFTVGLFTRPAYIVIIISFSLHVLIILQHEGAHDWGLPLVTFACLAFVPWGDALSVDAHLRARRKPELTGYGQAYGFALWVPGLTLGTALLAAAHSKLRIGGIEWVTGGAVKYHFVEDAPNAAVPWGLWVATRHELAVALSFAAVATEALIVLVVFARRPLLRLAFGLGAAVLFLALWLFQGINWPAWYVVLLPFLPWEWLPQSVTNAVTRPRSLRPYHCAVVAVVVAAQLYASASGKEIEPFLSNYPMYSGTFASTQEFDVRRRVRYSQYVFMDEDGNDITARIRAVPIGERAVTEMLYEIRGPFDQPIEGNPRQRGELQALVEDYERHYGVELGTLTVIEDRRDFDWQRGGLVWRYHGRPIAKLDPERGVLNPL